MVFTFVLKDKESINQGWWLKISSIQELCAYYKEIIAKRNSFVLENYLYGKEYNKNGTEHSSHYKEAPITQAVVIYGENRNYNILQSLVGFQAEVASDQLNCINESGAIYINRNGGYHSYSSKDKEYAVIKKHEIVFPKFSKKDIRIRKFPYGNHYYAYVGNQEVRNGNVVKWNTYKAAYEQAEKYLEKIK